jgi:hypothetical protein
MGVGGGVDGEEELAVFIYSVVERLPQQPDAADTTATTTTTTQVRRHTLRACVSICLCDCVSICLCVCVTV